MEAYTVCTYICVIARQKSKSYLSKVITIFLVVTLSPSYTVNRYCMKQTSELTYPQLGDTVVAHLEEGGR